MFRILWSDISILICYSLLDVYFLLQVPTLLLFTASTVIIRRLELTYSHHLCFTTVQSPNRKIEASYEHNLSMDTNCKTRLLLSLFAECFCTMHCKAEFITRASSTKRDHRYQSPLYVVTNKRETRENSITRNYVISKSIRAKRIVL